MLDQEGRSKIAESCLSTDFFLIGELHGSLENALVMDEILSVVLDCVRRSSLLDPIAIAFEWELDESERAALKAYCERGEFFERVPPFFLDSDGRFTPSHARLLKRIRDLNLAGAANTIVVDIFDSPYDSHEEVMAARLESIRDTASPPRLVLAEAGFWHAGKFDDGSREGGPGRSLAAILASRWVVRSAFLRYQSGVVMVEGVERSVKESASQQRGPQTNFDFEIVIAQSTAAPSPAAGQDVLSLLNFG